jgi:RES domain-containing protein
VSPADIERAANSRPIILWRGEVWRSHNPKYRADDTFGSRLFSGRYNRGLDLYPATADWDILHAAGEVWEALYTGLSFGICLAELLRHLSSVTLQAKLKTQLTQLRVDLAAVLDCSDLVALGIAKDDLLHDTNYRTAHALARTARTRGCEGLLVPSAADIPGEDGCVLIVFPDRLQPSSALRIIRAVTPNLGTGAP